MFPTLSQKVKLGKSFVVFIISLVSSPDSPDRDNLFGWRERLISGEEGSLR